MNTRRTFALAPLCLLGLLLLFAACKDKKIVGPDDPPAGTYRLTMAANDTFHYFVDNQNLVTIRVTQGNTMPTGVRILYRTDSNVGYIDDNGQTMFAQSDTIAFPCGSNPCMDYHCDDTLVFKDTIFGYAVVAEETVATASVGFFVKP
ncbi:MAG: hypothetical protein IPG71_13330 [bacterium]|nr:hypothetical protein [bacterium]